MLTGWAFLAPGLGPLVTLQNDEPPPIGGVGAQITFYSFLAVMLIVPWFMAWESSDPPAARVGDGQAGSSDRVVDARPQALLSSKREQRLWAWTAAVLVAIYATLGPVAELAAALRERNLLRVASTAVLLVVVAVLVVPWIKKRPGRREIGAAIGIAAVYLTTLIRLPVPEARSHLFEYGLVGILIYQALVERRRNGRRVPAPAFMALVITVLLGWLDEGIQFFLPNRTYDLVDVGFNAVAAIMGILATAFLAWARGWDVFKRRAEPSDTPTGHKPQT